MDELHNQWVAYYRTPFELSPRSSYLTTLNFLILGLLQTVSGPNYYHWHLKT